jgi:RimJ/RimL family protein N-acetyltransferase
MNTNNQDIHIRLLKPEDWQILRKMRLRALQMNPDVFLGVYAVEFQNPDEKWHEVVDGTGKGVFGLFDGGTLIGITAVFTWREDPSGQTGVMAYSFIEPAYRGRGLSKLLYEARIAWAVRHKPFKKLVIAHREGNEASKRAMLAHGFVFTDTKSIDWPDGTADLEYNYELDLETLRN